MFTLKQYGTYAILVMHKAIFSSQIQSGRFSNLTDDRPISTLIIIFHLSEQFIVTCHKLACKKQRQKIWDRIVSSFNQSELREQGAIDV